MSEQLDQQQAAALTEKIEAFAASLTDRERDAFATAMWSGDADESDVSGYSDLKPMNVSLLNVRFIPGSSKYAFPEIDHKGPVAFKPSPEEWK